MQHEESIQAAQRALLAHPLLAHLNGAAAWRTFMGHHVFAVWDFMSLAKRLQQELTCTKLPWLPALEPAHARFINEIVLAEESDDDGQGGFCSHFDYYCRAMRQAGADVSPIEGFIRALRGQSSLVEALSRYAPSSAAAQFVQYTLGVAQTAPVHVVAAVFFYGREDVIPAMFESLTAHVLHRDASFAPLQRYLRRHIDMDGDSHGPLAAHMVQYLCAGKPKRQQEAQDAALAALQKRHELWTGIDKAIAQAAA